MFCKHTYGKVDGNYQYCKKCGRAIAAPKTECNHIWEQIERAEQGTIFANCKFILIKSFRKWFNNVLFSNITKQDLKYIFDHTTEKQYKRVIANIINNVIYILRCQRCGDIKHVKMLP